MQEPAVQVEPMVQIVPSSHEPPSLIGVRVSQFPSAPPESQEAALHMSPELAQLGADPPVQDPV